jgi:hypothetical protein
MTPASMGRLTMPPTITPVTTTRVIKDSNLQRLPRDRIPTPTIAP